MKLRSVLILLLSIISSAAFGYDLDIRAMVVGDKVLELVETNPITSKADGEVTSSWISPNGKWVAYTVESGEDTILRLVDSDGGKPMTLLAPDSVIPRANSIPEGYKESWSSGMWYLTKGYGSPWSRNSKLLAVDASRTVARIKEGVTETKYPPLIGELVGEEESDRYVLVFDVSGRCTQLFPLGDTVAFGPCLWSGDGHMFVARSWSLFLDSQDDGSPYAWSTKHVTVFDTLTGTSSLVLRPDGTPVEADGLYAWTRGGASLLVWERGESQRMALKEWSANGGPVKVVREEFRPFVTSPDAKKRAVEAKATLSVEEVGTGTQRTVLRDTEAHFDAWTPNSRFLLCSRGRKTSDLTKTRPSEPYEYWLLAPEDHPLNHLSITESADASPTVSYDCLRMAYTSNGRVYVTNLAWREPTCWEKLVAGVALTEEDKKTILLDRGQTIGIAIGRQEWNSGTDFAAADEVRESIEQFLDEVEDEDKPIFFLRPGEHTDAFTYTPPDGPIENPETTVVGYLDAGYSWKVNIYADGHAAVVQKE